MEITDLQLADECVDLYTDHPAEMTVFYGPATSNICVGLKVLPDGTNIVTFRGSKTAMDWIRNFIAVMHNVPGIGGVELGFYQGLPMVMDALIPHLGQGPIYLTGHSRGASMAIIFGAMLILKGIIVAKVVVFGCPRPGAKGLKSIYAAAGVIITAYLNYLDPVPELPECIPPLFDYDRPFDPVWLNDPNVSGGWLRSLLMRLIPSIEVARHNMMTSYRAGLVRLSSLKQ